VQRTDGCSLSVVVVVDVVVVVEVRQRMVPLLAVVVVEAANVEDGMDKSQRIGRSFEGTSLPVIKSDTNNTT